MSSHDEPQPDELDADDLEPLLDDDELEELDDFDELEEWDDDGEDHPDVDVATGPATEGFELGLTVTVGEMDKAAVPDAVRGPLRRKVRELATDCRWKRVLVTFAGDAMIPSAIKALVAEVFGPVSPAVVAVQRGYPDEEVLTNERPVLNVRTSEVAAADGSPAHLRVEVDVADLTAADLASLLPAEIQKLCAEAADRAFGFRFEGGTPPTPAVYSEPLRAAGARRVAISTAAGDRILFDRELDDLVTLTPSGDRVDVRVGFGSSEGTTLAAIGHVLSRNGQQIAGQSVSVELPVELSRSAAIGALLEAAESLRPSALELSDGENVWPPLLQSASKGQRTSLRFRDGIRPNMAAAIERELQAVSIAGQEVDLDWPGDAAADPAVRASLIAAGPASLVFTFGGECAELVHPDVVAVRDDGERVVCAVETSHGKPAHLVPLIRRALSGHDLNGRKVDVEITGSGVVSRSMREAIVEALEGGQAAQGRLIDHGEVEYLFPAMFAFESVADDDVRVSAQPGDRTPDEIGAAMRSELDAREWTAATTVRVADESLAAAFIERGVGRVLLDGAEPVPLHPPMFATDRSGTALRIAVTTGNDAGENARQLARELGNLDLSDLAETEVTVECSGPAVVRDAVVDAVLAAGPAVLRVDDGTGAQQVHPEIVRTHVDVLGRRPNVEPPLLMLGIDTDDVEGATAALANHAEDVAKSRVLVVYRDGAREVAGAPDNPVVQATRATLDAAAPAVLQFRPAGAGSPAHFEVVSSSIDGLAVGARMRDPRGA